MPAKATPHSAADVFGRDVGFLRKLNERST